MLYCPYCGSSVHEKETYCVKCGKRLPEDINQRKKKIHKFNKSWFIPLSVIILLFLSFFMYHLLLENKISKAKEIYEQGEKYLLDENYEEAEKSFKQAIKYKKSFPQAAVALNFAEEAQTVHSIIDDTSSELSVQNYQQALALVDEAEKLIKNYTGPAVNQLINTLTSHRNNIKIEQLTHLLDVEPSIDELKILLWEADGINTDAAEEITKSIRDQIIDYTFAVANEQLNKKQFKSANAIVEDGLRYAADSDKLQSLQISIEKEKTAFESIVNERLEQALNAEYNETDAVELEYVRLDDNEQNQLVIKGEVKNIASVPINSVKVDYSLLTDDDTELVHNEVFVFPDTIDPNDTGQFEFTHYNIDENAKDTSVEINKITWYTE